MNEIKILNIFPDIYTEDLRQTKIKREELSESIKEQTNGLVKLNTVYVDKGSASLEGAFDEAIVAPYILQKVKMGEKENYDAVVIDCFGDPALDAARELVNIPVVGANQSACYLASQVGGKFSIINILEEVKSVVRNLLIKYGLYRDLASMPVIDVPVLALEEKPDETAKKAAETAKRTVEEDGSSAVVFGCTGMAFLVDKVQDRLKEQGIEIPVIEPLQAGIYNAIYWTLMDTTHSKVEYRPPRDKKRILDFEI